MIVNAVKTDKNPLVFGFIHFNDIQINIGGAMQTDNYQFIAPYNGYYSFTFSAETSGTKYGLTRIQVRKGDK